VSWPCRSAAACPHSAAEEDPARCSYLVLAGGGPMAALPCAFAFATSLLLSAAPCCMAEETSAVAAASLLLPEASACGPVLPAATLAGTAADLGAIGAAVGRALAERGGGGAGARRMGGFRWLLVLQNSAVTDIQHKTCLHAHHTEAMVVELAVCEAEMQHNQCCHPAGNSWTAHVLFYRLECPVNVSLQSADVN